MTLKVPTVPTAEKILKVRVLAELHGQLEQLVQATGRTKSFLTIEALKSDVGQEQWQIAGIQAGLQEADPVSYTHLDVYKRQPQTQGRRTDPRQDRWRH